MVSQVQPFIILISFSRQMYDVICHGRFDTVNAIGTYSWIRLRALSRMSFTKTVGGASMPVTWHTGATVGEFERALTNEKVTHWTAQRYHSSYNRYIYFVNKNCICPLKQTGDLVVTALVKPAATTHRRTNSTTRVSYWRQRRLETITHYNRERQGHHTAVLDDQKLVKQSVTDLWGVKGGNCPGHPHARGHPHK